MEENRAGMGYFIFRRGLYMKIYWNGTSKNIIGPKVKQLNEGLKWAEKMDVQ